MGNGVLQDILWQAGLHPKRKVDSLENEELERLFNSLKLILEEMKDHRGRSSEKDLFGHPGDYMVRMGKGTVGTGCPRCATTIAKESYLGGSIYYCPSCQSF